MSTGKAFAFLPVAWMSITSLALLASCSSLKGDQSGGRYTAPDGLFSLPVPALSMGAVTEDKCGTSPQTKLVTGSVSFHDDFGHVSAIQYERIPADLGQKLSDPASATGALRGYMSDVALAEIKEFSPQAHIVYQEPVSLPDGVPAWFAVIEIPEGSPMVAMSAENPKGKRLDSTRGFLALCHGDLFLTLSEANDFKNVLALGNKEPAAQAGSESTNMSALRDSLTKTYASMKFK